MQSELVLRGKEVERSVCFVVDNGLSCSVIFGTYQDENGVEYQSYGILAENSHGVVRRIPDISTDSAAVNELVRKMNRCRISQYHIDDVVEDFMAEN